MGALYRDNAMGVSIQEEPKQRRTHTGGAKAKADSYRKSRLMADLYRETCLMAPVYRENLVRDV